MFYVFPIKAYFISVALTDNMHIATHSSKH